VKRKREWRRWTEEDDRLMTDLFRLPGGIEEICRRTGRNAGAVWFRARVLHLSRRRCRRKPRYFAPTPPARADLLNSRVCPGLNGRGCGNRLRAEMVPSVYGYVAPGEYDLVCLAGHRFRAT